MMKTILIILNMYKILITATVFVESIHLYYNDNVVKIFNLVVPNFLISHLAIMKSRIIQ